MIVIVSLWEIKILAHLACPVHGWTFEASMVGWISTVIVGVWKLINQTIDGYFTNIGAGAASTRHAKGN